MPEEITPIGETVLTVAGSHWVSIEGRIKDSRATGFIDIGKELRQQDAHTRSELIRQGWKSPEELQNNFNPESLNYKKGVMDGRVFESREVAKELKEILRNPDLRNYKIAALIKRLEGK
jgi:hypothetical protein